MRVLFIFLFSTFLPIIRDRINSWRLGSWRIVELHTRLCLHCKANIRRIRVVTVPFCFVPRAVKQRARKSNRTINVTQKESVATTARLCMFVSHDHRFWTPSNEARLRCSQLSVFQQTIFMWLALRSQRILVHLPKISKWFFYFICCVRHLRLLPFFERSEGPFTGLPLTRTDWKETGF